MTNEVLIVRTLCQIKLNKPVYTQTKVILILSKLLILCRGSDVEVVVDCGLCQAWHTG